MDIQVKVISQYDVSNLCLLPEKIYRELNLLGETSYNIHFGQLSQEILFKPHNKQNNYMYVPESVSKGIMLYDGLTMSLWGKDKEIFLGPLIGIFKQPWAVSRIARGKANFTEMQHLKASIGEHCLCYYFSIDGFNWEEKMVRGISYLPQLDEWKYYMFPMPDVIYDQLFLREDIKPIAREIREKFRSDPNIKLINSRNILGKWELCERLSKYPDVKSFIPETIVYTKFDDVVNMLNKHSFIFLKSFSGTRGQEVLSIEKNDKEFRINYCEGKTKEITLKNLIQVEGFVEKFILGKDFIIQKGLRLLKYNGRIFDLRVLLQKDEKGVWKSTYKAVRIAREKTKITNHAAGGDITIYEKIYPYLTNSYGKENVPTSNKIVNTSIKIAKYLEKEFGSFGEIGIDIALDVNGDIYILEANARPDKFIDETIIEIHEGRRFIDLIIEENEKNNKRGGSEFDYSKSVSPAALSVFKYSKYLTMSEKKIK